jgi:hypothetical protein
MFATSGKATGLSRRRSFHYREQMPGTHSKCHDKDKITIKDLYPELEEEQLKDAEENLRTYFGVVWRIYQRSKREQSDLFDTPAQHS